MYSCQVTQDGRQALLKLSRGDMRRALNVLQVSNVLTSFLPLFPQLMSDYILIEKKACHAAYELTDSTTVYNCTGNPDPRDIQEIMQSMMNDSFETAYTRSFFHFSLLPGKKLTTDCIGGL